MKNLTTKNVLTFCILVLPALLYSQNIQILNLTQPTHFTEWNEIFSTVQVKNNTGSNQRARLVGSLRDASGRILLQVSGATTIEGEIAALENAEVSQINDNGTGLRQLIENTGFFPSAGMSFCVSIETDFEETSDCSMNGSNVNQALNLQYPFDKEEINTLRPNLFWAFSGIQDDVTYNLILKKKHEGDSKMRALEMGETILNIQNVQDIMLQYPSEINDLEEGASYVWQVEAVFNSISLGITTVWEFKVGEPMNFEDLPISKSYVSVNDLTGEPHVYVLGELKFKLSESSKPKKLRLTFAKQNKKGYKSIGKLEKDIELGDNYYTVDLTKSFNLTHNKKYRVELSIDGQKETKSMTFIYLNPLYVR